MASQAIHAFGTLLKMGDGGAALGTNEQQTLTKAGTVSGGTFTLTYSGQETVPIAWDAVAATVQSALQGLPAIGPGSVSVTGGPIASTAFTVTFIGNLTARNVSQITANTALLTGTTPGITVATSVPGVAAAQTYTTVAECRSITGPGYTGDTVEVTNHSSVGAFREHIASLLDGGNLTFDMNFIPTEATQDQTNGLMSKYLTRARTSFRLLMRDGSYLDFQGFVTGMGLTFPIDNVQTASVTVKVTGAPLLTVAS
jgi:predicted secreted protein